MVFKITMMDVPKAIDASTRLRKDTQNNNPLVSADPLAYLPKDIFNKIHYAFKLASKDENGDAVYGVNHKSHLWYVPERFVESVEALNIKVVCK